MYLYFFSTGWIQCMKRCIYTIHKKNSNNYPTVIRMSELTDHLYDMDNNSRLLEERRAILEAIEALNKEVDLDICFEDPTPEVACQTNSDAANDDFVEIELNDVVIDSILDDVKISKKNCENSHRNCTETYDIFVDNLKRHDKPSSISYTNFVDIKKSIDTSKKEMVASNDFAKHNKRTDNSIDMKTVFEEMYEQARKKQYRTKMGQYALNNGISDKNINFQDVKFVNFFTSSVYHKDDHLPLIKKATDVIKIDDAFKEMYMRRANSVKVIKNWMLRESESFSEKETCITDERNQLFKKESNTTNTLKNVSQNEKEICKNDAQRSKSNSFQCKADIHPVSRSLSDDEKIKDSLIVRDIVMKEYGEFLNRYKYRSLRRKNMRKVRRLLEERQETNEVTSSLESKNLIEENKCPLSNKRMSLTHRPTSLDVHILNYDGNQTGAGSKTPDSGLDTTEERSYSCTFAESSKSSAESLKFNQTEFLREALGDDYMNYTSSSQQNFQNKCSTPMPPQPKQRMSQGSIETNEISTLISTIDGVDSLYSTVHKSKKAEAFPKKTPSLPFFDRNSPDPYIYESCEHLQESSRSEKLSAVITIQEVAIAQASKAVCFCRQSPDFYGSVPHLEAEKFLLYATYKKKILEDKLRGQYEDLERQECFGMIDLQNFMFHLSPRGMAEKNQIKRYYVCLVYSNDVLFATDTVLPDKSGDIVFKKYFHFDKLLSDFQIYIKLFGMTVEDKKKKLCPSPMKMFSWKNRKSQRDVMQTTSSFNLIGESVLTISDIHKKDLFTLTTPTCDYSVSNEFTVDVNRHLEINRGCIGFLTIGKSNIVWNRRWCVLEGAFLKYWNYPGDESDKKSIGTFNLTECITRKIMKVDKSVCSRPRTFLLTFISENENEKQYFFQADNLTEFQQWKKQLDFVLISLKNWKCLKS